MKSTVSFSSCFDLKELVLTIGYRLSAYIANANARSGIFAAQANKHSQNPGAADLALGCSHPEHSRAAGRRALR